MLKSMAFSWFRGVLGWVFGDLPSCHTPLPSYFGRINILVP